MPAALPNRSPADDAIAALVARLRRVDHEALPWEQAAGRITAAPILTDRPSPPCDVSAMDGYALRFADVNRPAIPIAALSLPGRPAPELPPGAAVRIMTGAAVPAAAQLVIRREDTDESESAVTVHPGVIATLKHGQNIRRRGENSPARTPVVPAGTLVTPPVITAALSFGLAALDVFRPLRIALLITGDELLDAAQPAHDYEIRDSNGPALHALLSRCPWATITHRSRVRDERDTLLQTVRELLPTCDALLLTGGVSMGTHDFVPGVLRELGCDVVFHRLPIRPGGPLLGAIGPDGQAVFGLPGNPLSVMTTARRIALPVLAHRAGLTRLPSPAAVTLENTDGKAMKLWWSRPVQVTAPGQATLVESRGSGDVVSAAKSDGFVEIPPGETGVGPWPFYAWSAIDG